MPIRIKIPDKLRQGSERLKKRRIILAGASTLACILIAFGILMYYKIVILKPADSSFVAYSQPEDVEPPKPQEKPVETSKLEPSAPSPSIDIDVVTSSVPSVDFNLPSAVGTSGLGGGGLGGDGIGGGGGGEGGPGMGSSQPAQSAFVGQLWDFKRTRSGTDSPYSGAANSAFDKDVLTILSRFYNGRWQTGSFGAYMRLPTRLFTTVFYMPNCLETEAMHAYDPTGRYKLQSGRWAAVYKARVQAPVSGRFRFVGIADSVMAVRFNGENVLECGLHTISDGIYFGYQNEDRRAKVDMLQYKSTEAWNVSSEGVYKNAFMKGKEFTVQQGKWYDMEVLISEIGGMQFGFCLLLDDMGDDDSKQTKDGQPVYQIFRTTMVSPTADEAYANMKYSGDPSAGFSEESRVDPPYDSDSLVWPAQNPFSEKAAEEEEDSGGFFF